MAYIPDEWAIRRRDMSPTTRDVLLYYCMRANQTSGQTNVSTQKTSQDLKIRKDHVDEHDRKLVRMGLIEIKKDDNGGRIVQLCAPWQSAELRKRKPLQAVENTAASQDLGKTSQNLGEGSQDLGSPLNSSPNFGEIPQVLGNSPQVLGESSQNLGKSSQNLGAHIRNNQPINQPIEPAAAAVRAHAREIAPTVRPAVADRAGLNPLEPDSADPALQAIEAMNAAVFSEYRIGGGTITRDFESRIARQVGQLIAMGATPESLKSFFAQRQKLPGLNYLANDWQEWAVNLTRMTNATTGGANGIHRNGAASPGAAAFEQAAERIKAGKVF